MFDSESTYESSRNAARCSSESVSRWELISSIGLPVTEIHESKIIETVQGNILFGGTTKRGRSAMIRSPCWN